VHELAVFAQRDGQSLIHVHAADWVAYQAACRTRRLRFPCCIRRLRGRSTWVTEHPAHNAAQQPDAPRNHQQPDHKTHNASEKVHHSSVCQTGCLAKPPQATVKRVYARRKGRVKRKGVISTGCGTNCFLPIWANSGQMNTKSFKYRLLRGSKQGKSPFQGKALDRLGRGCRASRKTPESDQCPCMGARLRGSESSHLPVDNSPPPQSTCGQQRGRNRSTCARTHFCRRPWA
jgi:hypothetical protein